MPYVEMQHCYKRYTEAKIFANRGVSFEIEKVSWSLFLGLQELEINGSQYLRRGGHQ